MTVLLKQEQRAVTFVVHEGIAQINNHALWLDRTTLEQAQELEQYLGAREAGGIIFVSKPAEEQLKQFFFSLARFRPPADSDEPLKALQDEIQNQGIEQLKVAPQPLRLDGIGQGVRGVNALWFFAGLTLVCVTFFDAAPSRCVLHGERLNSWWTHVR